MGYFADAAASTLAEVLNGVGGVIRLSQEVRAEAMDLLVREALEVAGLEIEEGALSAQGLSNALRKKIKDEYDIDPGDMLDADSVKASLNREALRVAGSYLGVGGTQTEIANALKNAIRQEIIKAAESQDDDFLSAVGAGSSRVAQYLRAADAAEWPTPITNTTEEGQKNRDRQAAYRGRHQRIWIER